MFVQHLAEESHTQAKLDRKPRRNIQYKDVGKLIYLESIIPTANTPSKRRLTPGQPRVPRRHGPQDSRLQEHQGRLQSDTGPPAR